MAVDVSRADGGVIAVEVVGEPDATPVLQADTWAEVGQRLSRLCYWEVEDYRA
jgi:hypothetical protein